jgi:hypothetical protein
VFLSKNQIKMAKASITVIEALRTTAQNLENNPNYMWGHMGACNCGHLAQVVTKRTKAEIHAIAMQGSGDWNEQVNHYCGETKMPLDLIIFELMSFGFSSEDLKNLEKLSDGEVLNKIGSKKFDLKHNRKEDVVVYLKAWANHLEEILLDEVKIPNFAFDQIPEYA